MMGIQKVEAQLFYGFDLDAHMPSNHVLREIDRFRKRDGMREKLKPCYSHTGRPSIDPELIVRMLVIGYVMGIRSERRLCQGEISTWRTAGSVGSTWMTRCRIIRPSRGTAIAISGKAIC